MMRKLLLVLSATFSLQVEASESTPIEHFTIKGELVNVMAPCDPGCYVEIAIGDDVVISSPTSGVYWEKLYSLEDVPNKTVNLTYSISEGAYAVHEQSGTKIILVGPMEPHLIDLALGQCLSSRGGQTTMGMVSCLNYALDAWDVELSRIYAKLGGSDNSELEAAQLAWIEYRDAQFSWLNAAFGEKQGSKWSYGILNRKIECVRNRTEQLQSFYKGY